MPRRPRAIKDADRTVMDGLRTLRLAAVHRVIGDLIGVPTGEGERFRKLVDLLLTRLDPAETDADQSALSDLLQGLLAGNRQSPGQDLLSLGHLAFPPGHTNTAQVAVGEKGSRYVTCHVCCEGSLDSDVGTIDPRCSG
jgi:hypothetical protein